MSNLMSAPEVATYLGVPVATVYQWSYKGYGPTRIKVGRHLRYRRSDVDAWLDRQAVVTRAA